MNDRVRLEALSVAFRRRRRTGLMRSSHATWALRDIDLDVLEGELLAVVGPNGAGKTTLLQTIAGVIRPTRGRVEVRGGVTSLVELTAGFHRELSGYENARVQGALLGLTRRDVRDRWSDVIAFSGLTAEELDQPLRTFSAGMALRLGFALVAATDPDVLLVDEVLAVGDEGFQHRCLEWVQERQQVGAAVVMVTHDLDVALKHATHAALLDAGALVCVGAPADVISEYHERTADLDERSRRQAPG